MSQVVVSVMYNAPADPQAFEDYYAATHMPIAQKIPMVEKIVLLKGVAGPDGSAPAYYRMAQIYFADAATRKSCDHTSPSRHDNSGGGRLDRAADSGAWPIDVSPIGRMLRWVCAHVLCCG